MKIYRAIFISASFFPVLSFSLFVFLSIAFVAIKFLQTGQYNSGWIGIVHIGTVYSFIAFLLSSIPTVIMGLPVALFFHKFKRINMTGSLITSFILAALFMTAVTILFFSQVDIEIRLFMILTGGTAALANGAVFFKVLDQ